MLAALANTHTHTHTHTYTLTHTEQDKRWKNYKQALTYTVKDASKIVSNIF